MSTPVVIKFQQPDGALVRRRIDHRLALGDLRALAGAGAGSLTYTDEEGDAITVATQEDVKELVAFAAEAAAAGRCLRVVATVSPLPAASPSPPASETDNPWQNMTPAAAAAAGAHNDTRAGWASNNPHLWAHTRQATINLAFVALFGAFAVKMLLGIFTSTFGIFFGVMCLLFKIVPLCALTFFWFKISGKISGKKTSCHVARSGSRCGRHRGCFKRFIPSRFKNTECQHSAAGCWASGPPVAAVATAPEVAVPLAPTDQSPLIASIVGMGFDAESAKNALSLTNNKLTDALQILLSARD
jgi:hypothetical protein